MRKYKIAKVINAKINQWLMSIDDENLKKDLKNNVIVTGGCIVSLINNEVPHDFDVYFKTKDIAKRIAQYYCNKFNENNKGRVNKLGKILHAWVLDGEDVEKYNNNALELTKFAYGYKDNGDTPSGMIKNTSPERIKVMINSDGIASDVTIKDPNEKDVEKYTNELQVTCDESDDPETLDDALNTSVEEYLENIDHADEIDSNEMEKLNNDNNKYRPIFLSTNAITLSNKIQLVIRFYGEPSKIHDTFDYAHCMCYWDSADCNDVHYTIDALDSIINKELKYVGSKYPICSVLRMRKFLSRGWTINAGQILKMAFQISELNLQNINILEDQLVGVDSIYFANAINALRNLVEEKKNKNEVFEYDSSYLATVIDRIFK